MPGNLDISPFFACCAVGRVGLANNGACLGADLLTGDFLIFGQSSPNPRCLSACRGSTQGGLRRERTYSMRKHVAQRMVGGIQQADTPGVADNAGADFQQTGPDR